MRCFQCGHTLTEDDYCLYCGQDIRVYRRICNLSFIHYNDGLRKARVRDLSGAIISLKRSLKYNKRNIPARNLLGLILFETGDWVNALAEWVISLNIRPEDNPAEKYIKVLQQNTRELDALNRGIKKYNQALMHIRKKDDDLAQIQLEQVVSDSPHFLKAQMLLGLLYIEHGQYDKARQVLQNALRVDRGNVDVSTYLNAIRKKSMAADPLGAEAGRKELTDLSTNVARSGIDQAKFHRRRGLYMAIGALAAFLITWFLLTPARIAQVTRKANTEALSYTDRIQALEAENEELKAQIPGYGEEDTESEEAKAGAKVSDYEKLLQLYNAYNSGNYDSVELLDGVVALANVNFSDEAKAMYDTLMENVKGKALSETAYQGALSYSAGDYAKAAEYYAKVVSIEPGHNEGISLFYLALSYDNGGQKDQAKEAYQQLIELMPQSDLATQSRTLITMIEQEEIESGDDSSEIESEDPYWLNDPTNQETSGEVAQ